jgi:hypothetical protein
MENATRANFSVANITPSTPRQCPDVKGYAPSSLALYFCGAYKKSLHKPRTISGNRLVHISYDFNYYLQLLCLQFLSKTHLNLKKFTFGIKIKIALFLKSLLYQSMIAKIIHIQNKLSHNNYVDIISYIH